MADDGDYISGLFNPSAKSLIPKVPWPKGTSWTLFQAQPVAKPLSLIEGLLDGGSRMLVGGSSKTCKTWMLCDLAISQASGTPWLGFATQPYPTLYVNFELKPWYLKTRISAIALEKNIVPEALSNFYIWDLRGLGAWSLERFIEELLLLVGDFEIKLVIIDPYYKLLSELDNELDQTNMGAVLRRFGPINALGASVVFAMHFSKGNQSLKNPEDRISGAATPMRDCDGLLTLTAHEEPLAFSLDFILRDFPPVQSFVVRWQYPLLAQTDLDPVKLKGRPAGRPQKYSSNELFGLLACHDDQLDLEGFRILAAKELGLSKSTFYRKYEGLLEAGRIKVSPLSQKLLTNPLARV